jgi:hypothetical protein
LLLLASLLRLLWICTVLPIPTFPRSTPSPHRQINQVQLKFPFNHFNPLSPRKSFFRVQINEQKNSILTDLIRAPQTVLLPFDVLDISKTGARYAPKQNHPLAQPQIIPVHAQDQEGASLREVGSQPQELGSLDGKKEQGLVQVSFVLLYEAARFEERSLRTT